MDVTLGILLALLTAGLWGFRDVLLRKAFISTAPLSGMFATSLATFAVALIAAPAAGENLQWGTISVADLIIFGLAGVLNFVVALGLYYVGIKHVGASVSSITSQTSALLTPFMAMAFLSEPSSLQTILGVVVTASGLFMVSTSLFRDAQFSWRRQSLYPALAGLVWAVNPLVIRFGFTKMPLPFTGVMISSGFSLVPMAVYAMVKRDGKLLSDLKVDKFLPIATLMSGVGQITYYSALAFAGAVYVVPTYNLKTLFTVVGVYLLIPKTENIDMRVVAGAILAIAGIALISLP